MGIKTRATQTSNPAWERYAKSLPPKVLPNRLAGLWKLQEAHGYECLSDGFGLGEDDKSGLRTWSEESAFLKALVPFAQADGTGSTYAFWLGGGTADLASAPIVIFGSEGGSHIMARDFDELLRILSFDSEPMVDHDEVSFYKDDEHCGSDAAEAYAHWLRGEGLEASDDPESLVALAQEKFSKAYRMWFSRFHDDESGTDDDDDDDDDADAEGNDSPSTYPLGDSPDFVLTVLGNFDDFAPLRELAEKHSGHKITLDETNSTLTSAPGMEEAFEEAHNPLFFDDMEEEDDDAIESHKACAYLIARHVEDKDRVEFLEMALALVLALIEARLATAIKCDSSRHTMGLATWRRHALAAASGTQNEKLKALYHAWVMRPLDDETEDMIFSCGMHLFGKPEFASKVDDEEEAIQLFERAFEQTFFDTPTEPGLPLNPINKELDLHPQDELYLNKYGYTLID